MPDFNDDLLLTPAMRERLDIEAVPEHKDEVSVWPWFAWLQRSNGECRRFANQTIYPQVEQQQFTLNLINALNAELRYDGAWVTGWVVPQMFREDLALFASGTELVRYFTKAIAMWVDADGDVQFTIEIVDPMWKIELAPMESWVEQAFDARASWNMLMRQVLEPSGAQTYKRAQGQRPPSQH